ncbi:MAG: hypothetical protein U0575_17370 [Phycisphaerales bacterium]
MARAVVAAPLLLCACESTSSTGVASGAGASTTQAAKSPMVYISGFTVNNPGSGQQSETLRGTFRQLREGHASSQIVTKLPDRIVSALQARGIESKRIDPSESMPRTGWLVRGEFTPLGTPSQSGGVLDDLGSSFQERPVDLFMTVDNLEAGVPQPIFTIDATNTVHGIGAPPVPNPYAAAVKFVVKQATSEEDAEKLANEVADAIVAHMKGSGALPKGVVAPAP